MERGKRSEMKSVSATAKETIDKRQTKTKKQTKTERHKKKATAIDARYNNNDVLLKKC